MAAPSSCASFDEAYLASWWQLLRTPGVFRNPLYSMTQRRPLAGQAAGAITQFNEEHLKNKRPSGLPRAAADLRVVRGFDPALFNFTRAAPSEVLLRVALVEGDASAPPRVLWSAASGGAPLVLQPGEREHLLLANISPILGAHGLLVPACHECLPQVLTTPALITALRVMALAERPDFHLGFNSLAAWASVNHLHFHATYIADAFPADGRFAVERATTMRLACVSLPAHVAVGWSLQVEELSGWPLGGFKFGLLAPALTPDGGAAAARAVGAGPPPPLAAAALGAAAGALVACMVAGDCAHNLLLADRGATVFVLPRAHQAGGGADDGRMAVAFAETCGIGIVYSQSVYDSFSAAEYDSALAGAAISGDLRDALREAALVGVRTQGAQ